MYVRGPKSQTDLPEDISEPIYFNPSDRKNSKLKKEETPTIKELEENSVKPMSSPYDNKHTGRKKNRFSGILKGNFAKRSPIVAIILMLFGGGGLLGASFAPGIIMLHGSEVLRKDLNSQLSAYSHTSHQLRHIKLKKTTGGMCRKIKIACRFKTSNIKKTKKMFKLAGIDVEFDDSKGWGKDRGKIKKMTYVDKHGNKTTINSPEDFNKAMKHNPEFHKAMRTAYNPKFASLKDKPTIGFLRKMKTSYSKKLRGHNNKQLDRDMKRAVSNKTPIDFTKLRPEKDEDGKNTGRYYDKDGNLYDKNTIAQLETTENRINTAPTTHKLLGNLAKGALITSFIDTGCTIYKMTHAVESGAKLIRSQEEIRYAMVFLNTTDAMKAGDATPEQVEYLGKKLTEPDMRKKIVDESSWFKPGTKDNPPMIDNPNYGKSGLDSEFYKMSAYQDMPKITSQNAQFMAGGTGLSGSFSKLNDFIHNKFKGMSKKAIRKTCKIIQNPVVRGGSILIGLAAGVGSMGFVTAMGITGSIALSISLPYMTSMLKDMVAGTVTGPKLSGTDMMDAVSVGTSAMYNGEARAHGLMPLPPEQMAEYQNTNRQVQVAYANAEKYAAKSTPFDIYNQYSFFGSLARTFAPISINMSHSASAVITSIPSTFSMALSSLLPNASAMMTEKISPERYKMCNDTVYNDINVAADPTCVLLFGLPKQAMDLTPDQAVKWMVKNNEIDPSSEDGEPKDNGNDWNYKKWIENCVEKQPGAHEDLEGDDQNGERCADKEHFNQNWHYAKYKLSLEVNKAMDGELPGVDRGSPDNFTDGSQGPVGQEGWAYPTTMDASITSPFGNRNGSPHKGVDLVPDGGAVGKPIFAARDGVVVAAGPAQGFGDWIVIKHDIDGTRYDTVYGHMFDSGVLVKVGDKVKAGQQIGKIGYNGEVSPPGPAGAHLHFEIWKGGHIDFSNGHAIDPSPILRKAHKNNLTNTDEVRL